MRYLGGKARSAKAIAPYLTKWAAPDVTYWEPFLGGGSIAALTVGAFPRAVLADAHAELIELWRATREGWRPPDAISEAEYHALRHAPQSPLRTFAGFGASFGGKWWGGYVRPRAGRDDGGIASSRKAFLRKATALRDSPHVELRVGDYRETCQPRSGDVVYLDPPYAGTTGYSVGAFDHEALWTTAEAWARTGVHVYVSEFAAPAGWLPAWEQVHRNEMRRGSDRTDALYSWNEGASNMTSDTPAPTDTCEHPVEARSVLQDGAHYCTACQMRLNAPTEAHAIPARKWGDEPDPLPAAPTILVASTDPYVNTDGDSAREYAPKPAIAAAKDAFAGGWRYQLTYAAASVAERGEPGKRGYKPAHVLHTIALRLARDTEVEAGADAAVTVHERGYAVWAREDAIATPGVEGKWAWASCDINGRPYGARELRARLLRHGREVLNDPPIGSEPAAPAPTVAPRGTTPVPIAPVVPGSWGSLHAGDTVTGGDGKAYLVQTIERTGTWVGSGQPEVEVELTGPDERSITVRRSATEPAVIAERSDASPAAAILAAEFRVTQETIVDQFSAPAAPAAPGKSGLRSEAPHGRWGWYKLPHPITGEPDALWPRVSTIMKTHADGEGLAEWKTRMAMKGLAVSPDLIAMVASLDIETDYGKFREAIEQANNRAKSKSGANFGTAVDRFTERLDAGESVGSMGVPEGLRADVEAYARTLREHGLEVLPEFTQRTAVNVTHEYAGTWDRVVRRISDGALFPLDLKSNKPDVKTGRMSDYSWLEYVSQLAAYAYAEFMCTLDFTGYEAMPEVSKTKGLILHLPSGAGRGELYGVRLERGWHNFVRSIETRKDRSEAKSSGWSWLIERPAAPAPPAPLPAAVVQVEAPEPSVHVLVGRDIAAATTYERLHEIAGNAITAGVWTHELAGLALGREDQIKARAAADHAALAALWTELTPLGRWTAEVASHADARAAELAQLVSA